MKYWLILMKGKDRKLTCFPNIPLCCGAVEFLGFGFFMPLHILHIVQSKFITNPRMQILTAREGNMGNCHPSKTNVSLGFASVDIGFFLGDNFPF